MELKNKPLFIIMGVSGCGKTTLGQKLANHYGLPFYDADDFHPPSNIQKMKQGIPLQDADREPWLQYLARQLMTWAEQGGAVLACSALKESYRQILSSLVSNDQIYWIHLVGSYDLILNRMNQREGHFMPSALLQSQFNTLETPDYALEISINQSLDAMIQEILMRQSKFDNRQSKFSE